MDFPTAVLLLVILAVLLYAAFKSGVAYGYSAGFRDGAEYGYSECVKGYVREKSSAKSEPSKTH